MPVFACEVCDTTFRRGEHLSRHKLLHLGERPFTCPRCDRTFARRDTLQRHISVHTKPPNSTMPSGSTRRKVRRACRSCSQRKQRCDGTRPCSRCISKHFDCLYDIPSPPEVEETSLQNLASEDGNAPDQPISERSSSCRGTHIENDGSLWGGAASAAHSHSTQHDLTAIAGNFAPMSHPMDHSGNMPLQLPSGPSQQLDVSTSVATAFHPSALSSLGASVSDFAFWNDPQCPPMVYQDPYTDFDIVFALENGQNFQWISNESNEPAIDQGIGSPPAPSFLDARSSPEPLEGQGLRYDDYIRKTFGNRRYLRSQDDSGVQNRGVRPPGQESGKAHIPPLIGDFSPVLSSERDVSFWEPENLAHVPSLTQVVYAQIFAMYEKLNATNGQYTQFASGDFPSLAACNAFMQLFFEEFNPIFPLLHLPTFDPSAEPWLLVLAIIATGCRFSRVPAAVNSGDLMHEFLRRAFFTTIEEDYSSTCEPWLVQAGLLNQIGMAFSRDMRLTQSAQSMRSLLSSIGRQVNCFRESRQYEGFMNSENPCEDAWKFWVRQESRRRLAHLLWLVDSQYVLLFDLPPLIPMNLLQLRLPCPESLWCAPTASTWMEVSELDGTYAPLTLRQELNKLYKTGARQQGLGDLAILLMAIAVFRNAMEIQRSFREGSSLLPDTIQNSIQVDNEMKTASETFLTTPKAMEFLRILCPEDEEVPKGVSSLKSAILHHYHTIGVLMSIPLGELFCYCGFRVTSVDITHCETRLKAWFQNRGREARRMAFHASRLFAYLRHSNMYAYYEGRTMLIACQALWIYAAIAGPMSLADTEHRSEDQGGQAAGPTIRLDQSLTKHAEESWLQHGHTMRPYLAGVGGMVGADGVYRLIQEGSRIMCASSTWPLSNALGKCLRIFYQNRVGKQLEELE